jgi:hypothetical protein
LAVQVYLKRGPSSWSMSTFRPRPEPRCSRWNKWVSTVRGDPKGQMEGDLVIAVVGLVIIALGGIVAVAGIHPRGRRFSGCRLRSSAEFPLGLQLSSELLDSSQWSLSWWHGSPVSVGFIDPSCRRGVTDREISERYAPLP